MPKKNDLVSIYADVSGKCTKGADANAFLRNNNATAKFIGNGLLMVNRDDLFKSSIKLTS